MYVILLRFLITPFHNLYTNAMRIRFLFPGLFLAAIFIGACASTESVTVEEAPVEEVGPAITILNNQDGVLVTAALDSGTLSEIGSGGLPVFRSVAQNRMAIAFDNGSSSALYVLGERKMTPVLLHEGASGLSYTGDWSEDGSLFYFGYYMPVGKKMGDGDINVFSVLDSSISRVGCSASKAVLSMLPDGSLLVRNSDNIYQVSAAGCETKRTVDARKLYHVTVSPDGAHMAYILRDLDYNRETKQYEPDSTLYLESTTGGQPVKVVGDKYNPRNMVWSPDSKNMAYDVLLPEGNGQRAISIYDIDLASSGYMIRPDAQSPSQSHASYSADGMLILFEGRSFDGSVMFMTKAQLSPFGQAILGPDGSEPVHAEWLDSDYLFVRLDNGGTIISRGGSTIVWEGDGSAVFAQVDL